MWEETILSEEQRYVVITDACIRKKSVNQELCEAQAKPSFEAGEKRIIDWIKAYGVEDCIEYYCKEEWQILLKSLGIEK